MYTGVLIVPPAPLYDTFDTMVVFFYNLMRSEKSWNPCNSGMRGLFTLKGYVQFKVVIFYNFLKNENPKNKAVLKIKNPLISPKNKAIFEVS